MLCIHVDWTSIVILHSWNLVRFLMLVASWLELSSDKLQYIINLYHFTYVLLYYSYIMQVHCYMFFYICLGVVRYNDNITSMLGFNVGYIVKPCFAVITPALSMVRTQSNHSLSLDFGRHFETFCKYRLMVLQI